MTKSKRSSGTKLARKIFDESLIHDGAYHGPSKFAVEALSTGQRKDLRRYAQAYFESLSCKTVEQRTAFVRRMLEDHGYRPFPAVAERFEDRRGIHLWDLPGDNYNFRPGKHVKFYDIFQDDLIVACQLGAETLLSGVNLAFAHTDSPCLKGIGAVKQEAGLAYMLTEPYGDFVPSSWMGTPLGMRFRGYDQAGKPLEFIIGDKKRDPVFVISDESSHLDDDDGIGRGQLKVLLGGMPFPDKRVDARRRTLLGAMAPLFRQFGLTEKRLREGETTFFPAVSPRFVGADYSLITGFGQDDWAGSFAALWAFCESNKPRYTQVLHLHPGEEIDDEGRATVASNFFSEIGLPAIASMFGDDLGEQYAGLVEKGISMWVDTAEAMHAARPDLHDPRDCTYMNTGMQIVRHSGDEDRQGGYAASPRVRTGVINLLKRKPGIPHRIATMGNADEKTPSGDKSIHGPHFTEGINFSVPIIAMHRGAGEVTSPVDGFCTALAIKRIYGMKNRNWLPRKHKWDAKPKRLGRTGQKK